MRYYRPHRNIFIARQPIRYTKRALLHPHLTDLFLKFFESLSLPKELIGVVDHLNLQIQPSKRTHDLLLLLDVILQLKLFDLIEFITVLFIIFEHLKIPHQLQEYGLVVLSEVIMGLLLVQHRLALGFRGIENQSQVLNLLLIDLRVLPVGLY